MANRLADLSQCRRVIYPNQVQKRGRLSQEGRQSDSLATNLCPKVFRTVRQGDLRGASIVDTEPVLAVLKCPVCGSDGFVSSQQETLSTQRKTPGGEVVVCHCAVSHRFVVSLKEAFPPPMSNFDSGTGVIFKHCS